MSGEEKTIALAEQAREASQGLLSFSHAQRCAYLSDFADEIAKNTARIIEANKDDFEDAQELSESLRARLRISEKGLAQIIQYPKGIVQLDDPLNVLQKKTQLDEGLVLERRSVPLGVILFIFESRPDAFVQMVCLAIKTGNALILKPGKESLRTCSIFFDCIARLNQRHGFPQQWCTVVNDRSAVQGLLRCTEYIDLVIPRGSKEFVSAIMHDSSIPVLGHADGNCHIYVDDAANSSLVNSVIVDSKTQYIAVCNAVESILIHRDAQAEIIKIVDGLHENQVSIRGCERARALDPRIEPADEEDWAAEYLDRIVSIRVVDSLDIAIRHINKYGSHHTDVIITDNEAQAERFIQGVDSANVFVNCSSRFSDGYRYGLGAESGIATGKIHARGPVGLEGLCSYKWILRGNGHVVSDYTDTTGRQLHHKNLL